MIRILIGLLLFLPSLAFASGGMGPGPGFYVASGESGDYDTVKPTSTTVTIVPGTWGLGTGLTNSYIFNAGTGTSVQDYGSASNTGTFGGSPSWVAANAGVRFPAETDEVNLASTITLGANTTLSVRTRKIGTSADDGIVFGEGGTGSHYYLWLYSGNDYRVGQTAPWTDVGDITIYHDYTITVDSSANFRVFVDGVNIPAQDSTYDLNWVINVIGSGYDSGATFGLIGDVDYFYRYSRLLSDSEIADLYNHPYSMFKN